MRGHAKRAQPEPKPARAAPSYRPEPDGPQTDLFAIVKVGDEHSLLERLKQLGADVYCAGEFPTLRDRLRHVIEREQVERAVSGRDPAGKVELVAQAFERVCGMPLVTKKVSRGASQDKPLQT